MCFLDREEKALGPREGVWGQGRAGPGFQRLRGKEDSWIDDNQLILYCASLILIALLIAFNPTAFVSERQESHVPRFGDAYSCDRVAPLSPLNAGNPHGSQKSPQCLKRVESTHIFLKNR